MNSEQKTLVLNMASKGVRIDQIHAYTMVSITDIKNLCNQNYMDNKKINDDRNKRSRLQVDTKVCSKRKRASRIQPKDDTYLCKTDKSTKKPRLSQNLKAIRSLI